MKEKEKIHIENIKQLKHKENTLQLFLSIPPAERTEEVILAASYKEPKILDKLQLHQWTEKVILRAVAYSREFIKKIPFVQLTEPICFRLLQEYPSLIPELPSHILNEKVCRNLMHNYVEHYSSFTTLFNVTPFPELRQEMLQCFESLYKNNALTFLLDIREDYRTNEVFVNLFEKNPLIYSKLPPELKDYNRSFRAVSYKGDLLEHVPDEIKTKELCLIAYQNDKTAFRFIPEKYYDSDLALDIIKRSPHALSRIPKSYRSREVCRIALKTGDIFMAKDIPYPDMYLELLKNQTGQITGPENYTQFFNTQICTPELAKELLQKDSSIYKYLPPEIKKIQEICELAVSLQDENITNVPELNQIAAMYFKVAVKHPYLVQWMPTYMQTEEICQKLIGINPYCLSYIPSERISRNMCEEVVKRIEIDPVGSYHLFRDIPYYDLCLEGMKNLKEPSLATELFHDYLLPEYQTQEMLMEAVKKSGYVIALIPPDQLNPVICNQASETSPTVINWIPESLRTPDMYLRAVKENPIYENYVPEPLHETENIYSFCKQTEKFLQKELTYSQVYHIYNELPFQVDQVKTEKGMKPDATIRWDKEQKQFVDAPLQLKQPESLKKGKKPSIK